MEFRIAKSFFRSQSIRLQGLMLVVFFATTGAAQAGPNPAVNLKVDIGVADTNVVTSVTPNDIQAGFSGFSVVPAQNGASGFYDFKFVSPQLSESQVFSGVTVTLQAAGIGSNGLAFYDFATDVSGNLGDLVEDGVGAVQSDILLTLGGLVAGNYQMTTYHHWADRTSAQNSFNIGVNVGSGEVTAATQVPISIGFNSSSVSTATFQFTATGTNNVVVRLEGSFESNSSPFLNGFALVQVPEPSSWVLIVAAIASLCCGRFVSKRGWHFRT
jgi:hypothetical protein